MPYVMVPVPEEHVEDVMQFIVRAMARAAIDPWDQPSLSAIYESIDESSRSLLAFVARAASEDTELDMAEAARQIQTTPRETVGIMNEVNISAREANRPNLLIARNVTERTPNGRVKEKRVLTMEPEVAELVRVAEREELTAAKQAIDSLSQGDE